MRTLPVHWHEGMFLRPHHFQAADRYWADQSRQGSRWDLNYNWGIRRIDIDLPALKNYRFVVNQLQARLRDGTIVRVPQDTNIAELDLHKAFENQETVEVMLAVPTLEVGRANVGGAAVDETLRYRMESPPGRRAGREQRAQRPAAPVPPAEPAPAPVRAGPGRVRDLAAGHAGPVHPGGDDAAAAPPVHPPGPGLRRLAGPEGGILGQVYHRIGHARPAARGHGEAPADHHAGHRPRGPADVRGAADA